jgi:two-component system cell cycle sensor histidine kinase/response regulator CckA
MNEVRDPSAVTVPPLRVREKRDRKVHYRALLQAAPDAIVVVNEIGNIVFVNQQGEKLFGYRRDELIGQSAEFLVSEHFRGQHSMRHSLFLAAPSERPAVVALELIGLRKDGTEFPAEIRLSPLDTKQGVLVSNAIRDISDRRRTEEDLRRLASIVACSDDAITGKTLEGIITTWNASAEAIYGYSPKEAIGKHASMLVPKDRPDETSEILECLKRGETVDHFETVRVRKDGKEIQVEVTVSPIRDEMERIVGVSTIARDISERKRREDDQCRLAALVENSDDAIIGQTLDGIITHWNSGAQRIYGYSAAEIVGKSVSTLFPLGYSSEIMEMMEKIKGGERVSKSDTVRVRQDGKEIHVALTFSPIKGADGQVFGVSTVARDVTESKQLEEMLRQSQKMEAVGQLAGGVAHDFNNILGVILGYSELLLDGTNLDDPERKSIEGIQKAGDRAALLTRQLLAFSRKQVLQPRVLDLNAVVTGIENMLQRIIGEHIELLVVLNPALGRVKADLGQFEQVILNLVVNARDAMSQGGKLTIETANVELDEGYAAHHPATVPGPHIMLSVSDTGCGMDEKVKARIFEPFFSTKDFGKGTGLGLSTVYGIVKQSGGSVWVYSEVGIGTTFKIYLPRVGVALDTAPPSDKFEKPRGGSQTVLIVEDDAALLHVAHLSLEQAGYAILTAHTPADAICISESYLGPIDLMVTDVVMPGMSGAQLATHLSALRPEMKVLYVSGYTDDTVVRHGVLEPGLAFLQKPFSPRSLARKVGEVLATT